MSAPVLHDMDHMHGLEQHHTSLDNSSNPCNIHDACTEHIDEYVGTAWQCYARDASAGDMSDERGPACGGVERSIIR